MRRAAERYNRGDLAGAEALCRGLLREAPRQPDALHLLGLLAIRAGHPRDAEALLESALTEAPANQNARRELARAKLLLNKPAQALPLLEEVVGSRPEDAAAQLHLSKAAKLLGRAERALRALKDYGKLTPGSAHGPALCAELLQRLNRLDEALDWANSALAIEPDHPMASIVIGQVLVRMGRPGEALERLNRALDRELPAHHRAIALSWQAHALDAMGRYDEAYAQFAFANDVLRQAVGEWTETGALESIRRHVQRIEPGRLAPPPPDGLPDPLFVVGFPRSGTTLVERLFAAHPSTMVLDERDTLADLHRDFVVPTDGPAALEKLGSEELGRYRAAYWERAAMYGAEPGSGRLLVDKMPMNLVLMGLIHRLFPGARYVLVIRDPRDVCLSCFMQTFDINDATRHFFDLDSTAAYYRQCMSVVSLTREKLPLEILAVRYEDLVADPVGESRRMLDFAGLPWDGRVMEFHRGSREHLTQTPSYKQVSRPIYSSSIGRWRRYASKMKPVLPELDEFVRQFGYE